MNDWQANYNDYILRESMRESDEITQQNLYEDMISRMTGMNNVPHARKRLIGVAKLDANMHRMAKAGESNSNLYRTRRNQRNRLQAKLYDENAPNMNENYMASLEMPNTNLSRILQEEDEMKSVMEESRRLNEEDRIRRAVEEARIAAERRAEEERIAAERAEEEQRRQNANRRAAMNRARYARYGKKNQTNKNGKSRKSRRASRRSSHRSSRK